MWALSATLPTACRLPCVSSSRRSSLNNGLGGWSLYKSGVTFTASFTDNGTNLKTDTDKYGQHIDATATSAYPTMPSFSPQAIKGGDIKVN